MDDSAHMYNSAYAFIAHMYSSAYMHNRISFGSRQTWSCLSIITKPFSLIC